MKKSLFIFLAVIMSANIFAQKGTKATSEPNVKGINFQSISFDEAKKIAASQKKLIFMDAYTVWCGPCKALSNGPFKDDAVGEFFNKNFVNLKVDMEKGEGVQLAAKYSIRAYPTLLFINKNGDKVHVALGYMEASRLIEEGKKALALAK